MPKHFVNAASQAVKAIDKPAAAKDWEAFMVQHKDITGSRLRVPMSQILVHAYRTQNSSTYDMPQHMNVLLVSRDVIPRCVFLYCCDIFC
jgi:hypothetical protein